HVSVGDLRGCVRRIEDALDLRLHQIAKAFSAPGTALHRADDAVGGRQAKVRRNQYLLERFERIDVDRSRAVIGLIRALNDLFESGNDVLRGAAEALLETVKKAHGDTCNSKVSGSLFSVRVHVGVLFSVPGFYVPCSAAAFAIQLPEPSTAK